MIIIYQHKISLDEPLYHHFINEYYIYRLIKLYQKSTMNNTRNNKLQIEIGSSREKDIIASLCCNPYINVVYDIPTENEEDVIVNDRKISIKHSSQKGIRHKDIMITRRNKCEFNCDFLIIFINFSKDLSSGKLDIIYIKLETIILESMIFQLLKKKVTKKRKKRPHEFTSEFFKSIVDKATFHIKIKFNNIQCEKTDPIKQRCEYIMNIN